MFNCDWEALILLDETLQVPPNTRIRRGPIGVYRFTLFGNEAVLMHRFNVIDDDSE